MSRTPSGTGFALIELLVALLCASLVAAAVSSLLVGSAAASRRQWSAVHARGVAAAALAGLAADLAEAGAGLEDADAIRRDGVTTPLVDDDGAVVRIVRSSAPPIEIEAFVAGGGYRVAAAAGFAVGDQVAAVGQPSRPGGAPLPSGEVIAAVRTGGDLEVLVGWRPAEAALLTGWGEPRALVQVEIREYATRRRAGGLQLRRRDGGRTWQPVADGIEALELGWLVDTDADGSADARITAFDGQGVARPCGVELEARVRRWRDRSGQLEAGAPGIETARRWVDLRPC